MSLLEQEIYRLVDPNQFCTKADADKVINQIEQHIENEGRKHFRNQMEELGVVTFEVHHDNYYGKDYLDELVTGKAYMEKFKQGAYSLRIYDNYRGGQPFVNVLIHGKTIVGKGSKHYRYLIEGLVEEFESDQVKYPIKL